MEHDKQQNIGLCFVSVQTTKEDDGCRIKLNIQDDLINNGLWPNSISQWQFEGIAVAGGLWCHTHPSIMSQTCSIGERSGLLAGHQSCPRSRSFCRSLPEEICVYDNSESSMSMKHGTYNPRVGWRSEKVVNYRCSQGHSESNSNSMFAIVTKMPSPADLYWCLMHVVFRLNTFVWQMMTIFWYQK